MLQMLLESAPHAHRRSRPADAAVSVAIHATILVAAIIVTAPATRRLVEATGEAHVVFVPQRPVPPLPARMPPITRFAAPEQRWVFTVPTVVPPTIPPIQAGPVRDELTVPGLTRVGIVGQGPAQPSASSTRAFDPDEVDRIVLPYPDNTPPRYPASLQTMGVEGEVVMRFVVDTLGRVEPSSAKVVLSTHDLFERAVREALANARFHPAEIGGMRVRQ